MIDEVAAGVLVDVVAVAGRRLGSAVSALRGRRYAEDLAIARWFDTYQLTGSVPALPDLSQEQAIELAGVLQEDEVQAVLHELLAARLTDAPEADVGDIKAAFELTLGELDASGIDAARMVGDLFDYYDREICALVGRLEGTEPALLSEIREEALSARMVATLHAIERHLAALRSRPDRRMEADFLARYRRHVVEQHGRLEPPDFERRRRVPISSLYVSPRIFQLVESDQERAQGELNLQELANEIDRTVLLGDPGGGKTTAANVLMHDHAIDEDRRIPFLVTLRDFAAHDPPERSVAGYIEHRLETFYQCPAPSGTVGRLLLTGRALVIFDGLDELLDTSRRSEVTTRVERFCTEYPLTPVIVTSRLVGYDQARLDDRQFARYQIGGFADDQVGNYVGKWFAQEEGIEARDATRWASAFMDESAATPDLRANPLMLALMCILYRGEGSLPRNRAEVYEQCANLLFRKWDARRHIHMDLRAGHHLEPALQHLAWWMFSRDQPQPAVTERELIGETAAFLLERGFESELAALEAASEFVHFCRGRMWVFSDTGTTAAGEMLYTFTHRTFLEYFAATYLAYGSDTAERLARRLAPHVACHEWEVVGELAVQIKDRTSARGAQRIYTTMLGERRRRTAAGRGGVLQFLARCLRSVDPSPQMVRRLTQTVLDHLFAGSLDDPVQCLPLCWLMASCSTCKEIVDDELASRITTMAMSEDPNDLQSGLQLALWLPVGISGDWAGEGPRMSSDSTLRLFWQKCSSKYIRTHAQAIVAASYEDSGMRFGALSNGLMTMDQALEMPENITPLFQRQSIPLFGIERAAYLINMVTGLILGWPGYYDVGQRKLTTRTEEDFTSFGRYLLDHPRTPWIAGPVDAWPEFFWNQPSIQDTTHITLDPVTYLGAAATLFITAECMNSRVLLYDGPERFGLLSHAYPYVEQRWHIEAGQELPDLPVPEEIKPLFRKWAEKRVSFVKS